MGRKECPTLKINTSDGKLSCVVGVCLSPQSVVSEWVVPCQALASADKNHSCLVLGHSLISGCNRSRGQMLKGPGPGEDRCLGSRPLQTEGLVFMGRLSHICTHQSRLEMLSAAGHFSLLTDVCLVPRMVQDRNLIGICAINDGWINGWMGRRIVPQCLRLTYAFFPPSFLPSLPHFFPLSLPRSLLTFSQPLSMD